MAAVKDTLCSWCRSAEWRFKCSTCDPRQEKTLCSDCSTLWHSRGFARSHQLTSINGKTRTFLAWSHASVQNGNFSTMLGGRVGTATSSFRIREMTANGVVNILPADTTKDEDMKLDSPHKKGEEASNENRCELEVVSNLIGTEDNDITASDEQNKLNAKAKISSAQNVSAANSSPASVISLPLESAASNTEEELRFSVHKEQSKLGSPSRTFTGMASDTATTSVPVSKESTLVSLDTMPPAVRNPDHAVSSASAEASIGADDEPALAPPAPILVPVSSVSTSVHTSTDTSPIQQQTNAVPRLQSMNLDELLRYFPTTDDVLMEMLAARIENALAIEDALICAKIGNCQEPQCRSVLQHYEHCRREEMCGHSKCSEIYTLCSHQYECASKVKRDGSKSVCSFCIRIHQRRSFGLCVALDHLISDQRRTLQSAQNESTRNIHLQNINKLIERKQPLHAKSNRLNQLAIESSFPIFNFPKYNWHFSNNVFVKEEPIFLDMNDGSSSDQIAAESANGSTLAKILIKQPIEGKDDDAIASDYDVVAKESRNTQDENIPGSVTFNTDFINRLLRAKSERGENGEVAQREFNGVLELGFAIVDASFCAPSKAQRCLLNCKSILDHLQHHLDLKVCNQPMCGAVEHHFAHLSDCSAHAQTTSCEYCLRIDERRLLRSVDFMEAEQPEAEAKVQRIINDMTASFSNHRPEEREQEMIQLEDELDQAEVNKQELLEKLDTRRSELQTVRRRMEMHDISTTSSHQLPVHFTKTRRSFEPESNKKRRRTDTVQHQH